MGPPFLNEEMFRFMADDYASKIMSATYGKPLSIQEISEVCKIPAAVAYRRVKKMVGLGLLSCVREEAHHRKKVRFYLCAFEMLRYTFDKGVFSYQLRPVKQAADPRGAGEGAG